MTRAVRLAGIDLKPFIYRFGVRDGFVHPGKPDRRSAGPVRSYAPENFDMTFQGKVPARKALQMSLNVPAVAPARPRRRQSPGLAPEAAGLIWAAEG